MISVLDRLQTFLPQIAQANESLKQQMESFPEGHFDIENTDDADKVIEMVSPSTLKILLWQLTCHYW